MTPLEMIKEWRRGCSCSKILVNGQLVHADPSECIDCTRALIDAVELALMQATPRTDAEVIAEGCVPGGVVPAKFARQLERELAATPFHAAIPIPRFLRHERNTDCQDGERERALTLEGIKAVLTGADNIDAPTTAEQRIDRALAAIARATGAKA